MWAFVSVAKLASSDSVVKWCSLPDAKLINFTTSQSLNFKHHFAGKDDLGSLFASAEEFSTLLEDTATNSKQGSSNAVSNTDNSSMKQLAWEDTRDKWLKGYNRKMHGAKKGNFKKGKKPQNGGFNKMADKKGGKRKGGSIGAAASKKKKFK